MNSITKKLNKREPWKISKNTPNMIRNTKLLNHQIKRRKLNKLSKISRKINRNK